MEIDLSPSIAKVRDAVETLERLADDIVAVLTASVPELVRPHDAPVGAWRTSRLGPSRRRG